MFELARVRLLSVGPKGARYQDVTLDLRNVGAPVAQPAAQESLFDVDFEIETSAFVDVPRRPSPATVLFLENGGGKSVLIKLIFSVMLPGRRQVVGTTSTRVLENFVLAQDVAHVVLEWRHVRTGRAVVVGKVSAWRDHVVSADPGRLAEAWYSFHPSDAFALDSLPVSQDGRAVSTAGFRDRLGEANRADPNLRLVWETNHGEWTEHLTSLGLDPELFRYQRRMNAGEGEAADAFTFRSDEAFVDWLLTAVTGEDEPRALGEVVEQYAAKLSQRDTMIAERDFVAGALDRLTPLAAAARDADTAAEADEEVRRDARRFGAAVAARREREDARLTLLAAQAEAAAVAERDADARTRRLHRITGELRRTLAGLRLLAAEAEQERIAQRLGECRDVVDAWRAAETIITFNRARDAAERVRRVVAAQETKAAPVLAERDAAARRLARGLLAIAATADEEAARWDENADDREKAAERADGNSQAAAVAAERERNRARTAEDRVAAAAAAVRTAVDEGLLASPDESVPARAEDAGLAADAAAEQIDGAQRELEDLGGRRRRLGVEARAAGREREGAQAAAGEAARVADAGERAAAALACQERLADLLGADEIELDTLGTDAEPLLELLAAAVRSAEQERVDLRIASVNDQRVLDALGAGGLLPPADEITKALAVLADAGITAWSGWRYLAMVSPEARERVLSTHPHLVDGIVLNTPDHLGSAEELLTGARLWPRSVVAVGTTLAITDEAAAPPAGIGFIVPPNPAMFDEDRAEEERQAIAGRQRERADRLEALGTRVDTDQRLHRQLSDWHRDYPPGALDALRTARTNTAEALAVARERETSLLAAVEEIDTRLETIQGGMRALREAEAAARRRAEALTALAELVASVPEWHDTARIARAAADGHERAATDHREQARRLRRDAATSRRAADDQRRVAAANRTELRDVPGAGAVEDAEPVPGEPVTALRDAYAAAKEAYARVEVGEDLRRDLTGVEKAEVEARAAVEQIRPDSVRALAAALLASPDGADAPARAAASARAERALRAAGEDHTAQATRVGGLKNEYDRLPAQEVALEPPYPRPTTIETAEELVTRAQAEWEAARRDYDKTHGRRETLDADVASARTMVDGFRAHVSALADVIPDTLDDETVPFAGGVEDAAARRHEVLRRLRESAETLRDGERVVRKASDALATYAADTRFEPVTSPVRRQIVTVEREELPRHAGEWATALRPRLRSLTDDLAQIDRHRSAIVARLRGMVEQALSTLRAARRLSTLPDGLGDWSGQEFLRITFETAEPRLFDERLGAVIDEATAAPGGRDGRGGEKKAVRRDGLGLLLRGVRAAMPKGVKADMLKPDAVLRTERVRVAEVGDVFSGGQLLTAAIILYCTMAALRANDRGFARRPHTGVLFLDNPIGRASAGYLLELQIAVADTLGVQLVYTTGLFDTNALSVFPLVIRLRNDADLRAGLKYLTVDELIRSQLAGLGEPDRGATLTSTRVYARPAPAQPAATRAT